MNFLYLYTEKSIYDLPWTLKNLGMNVTAFESYEFNPLSPDPAATAAVETELTHTSFDFCISYLFLPEISDICQKLKISYISWVYDSPQISLYDPAIYNCYNYTFIFDKKEYERLKILNVPHVYYLPMAANLTRTGVLNITAKDEADFSCDISFIGNLYENNNYNETIHLYPEPFLTEIKTYLMKHLCNWSIEKDWPSLSPDLVNFMQENLGAKTWNHSTMNDETYLGILLLTRKLAEMDRLTVLNTLAEQFTVDLYTTSTSPYLEKINVHPPVNYYIDMNKIFYLSKINLNITLPSIETGLPQRIFDIMGCGGFVLTNYQKEVEDFFTIGKEIEVFHSLDELKDKTAYYLSHESKRLHIAMAGYQKVRTHHTYEQRIQQILSTIKEEQTL